MNVNNYQPFESRMAIEILSMVVQLLNREGHDFQAGEVRGIIDQISAGDSLMVLDTNAFWGGPGSVVDCSFLHGSPSTQESVENAMQLGNLIICLVDLLETHGFATDLMLSRRYSYQYWKDERERS